MLIRLLNQDLNSEIIVISLMGASSNLIDRLPSNVRVIALNVKTAAGMLVAVLKLRSIIPSYSNLYCWMYHANVVGSLLKCAHLGRLNLIWGVRHSLDDFEGESFSTRLAIRLGGLLKSTPDSVVHCSKRSQKQHLAFGYNTALGSHYIPNGYLFEHSEVRTFSSQSIVIGAAGRFHPSKDYLNLFSALAPIVSSNASLTLKVCGRGMSPDNSDLIGILEQARFPLNRIDLLGEVSDMSQFYGIIDLFLLSSKTEGFPNVLAEASAYGCAVISTDVGDAKEIVVDHSWVVPACSSEKLEQAVMRFLNLSVEDKLNITKQQMNHVRNNYSIDKVAQSYNRLLRG